MRLAKYALVALVLVALNSYLIGLTGIAEEWQWFECFIFGFILGTIAGNHYCRKL